MIPSFIRYLQGLGNTKLYLRLRNTSGKYWNFVSKLWVTEDSANCRIFYTEFDDSDDKESLYIAEFEPPATGGFILSECVELTSGLIVGYEPLGSTFYSEHPPIDIPPPPDMGLQKIYGYVYKSDKSPSSGERVEVIPLSDHFNKVILTKMKLTTITSATGYFEVWVMKGLSCIVRIGISEYKIKVTQDDIKDLSSYL